ncbi:MAG: MFS transporter [Anaerolineales bacterium]|nr:MFS transporter [Anaerolineales bacterium]
MGTYISLLQRNRNYRNLWFARVVSNLGDWFNLLASAALIAQLTEAGTAISFLFLMRFIPLFLMSPFAGVIADRFDRRHVLIATDVLRAITVASFLIVDRPERLWLLYVLTALQFVFSAVFTPAETALIPNVVDEDDLITANALDSLTWSTMLAIGAMLGGLATALFGVTTAFLLDAASFLLSAYFVARVVAPPKPESEGGELAVAPGVRAGLVAFVDGLRYLAGQRFLLVIALVKAAGALVWGVANVIEIPLAETVFPLNGNGSLTLGLLYAAVGIGTGVGPLVLRNLLGDSKLAMQRAITIGFICLTAGLLGLALAPTLPWLLVATTVRGLGSGGIWVFSTVLLQVLLPDHVRGRVFAFEFAALTLTQSIGTLWAGYAYDTLQLSISQIFVLDAVVSAVLLAAWLLFQWRLHRRPAVVAG